jgi:hypothetical protein
MVAPNPTAEYSSFVWSCLKGGGMSDPIVYVDVDDTLVRMAGTKRIRQTCSALRCCVRGAQRNAVSRGVDLLVCVLEANHEETWQQTLAIFNLTAPDLPLAAASTGSI